MKRYLSLLLAHLFIVNPVFAQLGPREIVEDEIIMSGSGSLTVPSGTTGERPTPSDGMIRFNETLNQFEGYYDSAWDSIGGGAGLTLKGNMVGFDGSDDVECVLDKTPNYILTVDASADCGFDMKPAPVSTTLDAKGEIQTFSTVNASFGPGSDGDIIYFDSGETTGLNSKPYSPLTTKGDLYIFDTDNNRLAAGNDGDIIYYDSGQPSGLNQKPYSPLTTKGSIYTYTTAEFEFLAGADGDIVYYDSTQPSGLNQKPYSPLTTEGDL